ncbi:hypothetical protein C6503_09060 [Candidatus Poribacteria bacterium]|nr:MAG: hypothetical protein C6503_09060 [Candidatus Poribacteria bacterium]
MLNSADTIQADGSNTLTLQPMGFGEILDTIFSLYREHLRLFLGIVAVDFSGNLVIYFLARFLPNFPLKDLVTDLLVGMPFGLVIMGGIIVATATIYLGKRLRSLDALQQVGQRFWRMLVCHLPWNLVFGIPRIGISVLLFTILSPNIALTTPILFTIILLVFMPFSIYLPIDLGSIIYGSIFSVMVLGQMWARFIPSVLAPFAIYFTVRWLFVSVVILLERPLIRRAFARSSELTRGRWWRIWGTLISLSVLSFAIQRIVVLTIGFILMLTKVVGETTSMNLLKWIVRYGFESSNPLFYTIMWWINRIVGSFIFPIWIIGITLLYFDLRIRKEGFNLEMQVNSTAVMHT